MLIYYVHSEQEKVQNLCIRQIGLFVLLITVYMHPASKTTARDDWTSGNSLLCCVFICKQAGERIMIKANIGLWPRLSTF